MGGIGKQKKRDRGFRGPGKMFRGFGQMLGMGGGDDGL